MAVLQLSKRQSYILIALSALIGIVVLCISLYFGLGRNNHHAVGEFVPHSPLAPVTITSDYPFDVNENLEICNRMRVHIAKRNTTDDAEDGEYAEKISRAMKRVANRGGGTVSLDEGIYMISKPLLMPSKVCLRGVSMLKTELRMMPKSPPYPAAGMIRIIESDRVSLIDLTINGNRDEQLQETEEDKYGRYGLYAEVVNYLWVRGVRFNKHLEYGCDPHGVKGSQKWSNYVCIQGSVADDNGKDGFTLDQSRNIALLDSSARRNVRHGVNIVTGSRNVLVRNLQSHYNGVDTPEKVGCGLIVQNNELNIQTKDVIIANASISESPRGGVCISGSVNITLTNVTAAITRFQRTPCFVLRKSREVKMQNSTCIAYSGIRTSNIASMVLDDRKGQVKIWRPVRLSTFQTPYIPETDPVCNYGTRYGTRYQKVCCPYYCKKCGGKDCGVGGPKLGNDCCMSGILKQKRSCTSNSAPCKIDKAFLPEPEIFIDLPNAELPLDDDLEDEESAPTNSTDTEAISMPGNKGAKNATKKRPAKKDGDDDDDGMSHGVLKKKPVVVDVNEPVVINKTVIDEGSAKKNGTNKVKFANATKTEVDEPLVINKTVTNVDSVTKNGTSELSVTNVTKTKNVSNKTSPDNGTKKAKGTNSTISPKPSPSTSKAPMKTVTITKPKPLDDDENEEKDLETKKKVTKSAAKDDKIFPYWNPDPFVQYLSLPKEYMASPSKPSGTTSPGEERKKTYEAALDQWEVKKTGNSTESSSKKEFASPTMKTTESKAMTTKPKPTASYAETTVKPTTLPTPSATPTQKKSGNATQSAKKTTTAKTVKPKPSYNMKKTATPTGTKMASWTNASATKNTAKASRYPIPTAQALKMDEMLSTSSTKKTGTKTPSSSARAESDDSDSDD